MKTIGLLGGMSWESTRTYYEEINRHVRKRLGGLHSARILLNSVDFAEIETLQAAGDWNQAGEVLAEEAQRVERGGADLLLICTNTMHKVFDRVQAAVTIPMIHLADATAERLVTDGRQQVGLLGTRFTMEQDFYKERLVQYGIDVLTPSEGGREAVHRIIYEELCCGLIEPASREAYVREIDRLRERGAQSVILGCTEIGLLVGEDDSSLPIYDTTRIHVETAVDAALS